MTFSIVLPMWQAVQTRFHKSVKALSEQDLALQLGTANIGNMIHHNAEVEFMFAEWFFGKPMPESLRNNKKQGESSEPVSHTNPQELVAFLEASNEHLVSAMRELSEEAWHQSKESPIGASTPLEAVGRLMYHTGIHSGQISIIQKNARPKSE